MKDQLNEEVNMAEEEKADPISANDTEEMDDNHDSPIKLNSSKTSRRRAVVDSDSESDDPKDGMNNVEEDAKSDSELEDVGLPPSSGRARRIIMPQDSDSDEGDATLPKADKSPPKTHGNSDDEHSSSSSSSSGSSNRSHRKKSDKQDESDEDELPDIPNPSITVIKPKTFESLTQNSDVYGAGSSSEEDERRRFANAADSDNNSASDKESKSKKKKGSKDKRPPVRRASEKAREKTVQELASKTQKMTRESRVSLPYSKPKQLTLDEFLKKRKEAKKSILPTIISSSALGTLRNGISLNNDSEDIIPPCPPSGADSFAKKSVVEVETAEVKVNDDIGVENEENDLNIDIYNDDKVESGNVSVEETNPTNPENECVMQQVLEVSDANPATVTTVIEPPISELGKSKETVAAATAASDKPCDAFDDVPFAMDVDDAAYENKEKEAELQAFLDSMKPKPKRKSIKEMLMALPGYKELASLKPKIGGGDKKVISLDNIKSGNDLKRQQKIELLKDRFVRHCITAPKPVKGEHIKLKIKKKEEDSQGIEHLVEGEVDYVCNPLNEDDEAMGFLGDPKNASPQAVAPGAQRHRIQDLLLGQIRQQKLKEIAQRRKDHAMYNDEMDVDQKGEMDDEEILNEDEDTSGEEDGDSELGEEEEELEDLLSCATKEKKKKKKSQFVDDEAEDEDEDVGDDDDDDDNDEDQNSDTDASDDNADDEIDTHKDDPDKNDVASVGISDDSLPAAQTSKIIDENESVSNSAEIDDTDDVAFNVDVDCTPKVTTAVLNHRTPSDFWIPARTNSNSRHSADELSPLIPRLNKSQPDELRKEPAHIPESTVPESLANVISETDRKFDDLVDLCSGRFVSQINNNASETQEDSEFGGFDFADDDDVRVTTTDSDKVVVNTPVADSSKMAVDGITPKLSEKIPKTKLLMQFEQEAEISKVVSKNRIENNLDTDEEEDEEITTRMHNRKQKRLQFSDDEDDVNEEEPKNSISENELSENEELEVTNILPIEKPKPHGFFFSKDGRMKRKFVEDEAELSGSEEGSDDEDERGLNHYELEEGDDEEFDEEVVRNQAERAHLKQLLDEDDRNIRFLQEKYLESGDLNVDGQRERKFKWLNISAIDDDANMADSDEEHAEENPEETSLKLAWLDKRKWISENSHLLADESESLFSTSQFARLGKGTIKRIESCVESSTSDSKDVFVKEASNQKRSIYDEIIKAKAAAKKAGNALTSCSEGMALESIQPDQSSKSMSQPFFERTSFEQPPVFPSVKKGSFLSRGGLMLAKLAEITKSGDPVSNVKSNSRNFVFSHITPPNVEKTDGSTSKVKRGATKAGKSKATVQTKKIKVDRCFNNLDDASKEASIFKWL